MGFSELEVVIGKTSNTPSSILDRLATLEYAEFKIRVVSAESISQVDVEKASLIVDLTYSILYCRKLSEIAAGLQVPFISQQKSSSTTLQNYFHPTSESRLLLLSSS